MSKPIPVLSPGEPYFFLRGNDTIAREAVIFWIRMAASLEVDAAVLESAWKIADAMEAWPSLKVPDADGFTDAEAKQLRYEFSRRAHRAETEPMTEGELLAFERGYNLAKARARLGEAL